MKSVLNIYWKCSCWSWNSNTLATWCEKLTHLKRPWCWERVMVWGDGDDRGWNIWIASPTPRVYKTICPLSPSCRPTMSSSVFPFSFHLQPFPKSGSFQMSQFFASGGQSTGVSASASVLPMNTQDWYHLGWTACISLQSKGLSRVFSNTTVQKHQFFSTQLSL